MKKRIMIFGIPGCGKSTFANQLGPLLKLPVYHLDRYFFVAGWQERDKDEFIAIQRDLVSKDAWIIDGNATKSLEIRYARADLVLYFRFNRLRCLWRVFKRLLFKDHRISDRAEGCDEILRFKLITYLWTFDERVRKTIEHLKKTYPNAEFQEVRNSKELQDWLKAQLLDQRNNKIL